MQTYGGASVTPTHGKLAMLVENATDRLAARAWSTYAKVAVWFGRLRGLWSPQSEAFAKLPLHLGAVKPQTLTMLQNAIIDGPIVTFDPGDHAAGYCYNPNGDVVEKIFNAGFRFRQIGRQQCEAISRALNELAPEISAHLGTGWRVINVKSWSIQSDTVPQGPNAWHLDGFPVGTFKLMIYLTPVSPEMGTTEVKFDDGSTRLLEGNPGMYLLFDPSALWHRGVAPADRKNNRVHVEITLARSLQTDSHLVFGGLNSAYPRFPWIALPKLQASA